MLLWSQDFGPVGRGRHRIFSVSQSIKNDFSTGSRSLIVLIDQIRSIKIIIFKRINYYLY